MCAFKIEDLSHEAIHQYRLFSADLQNAKVVPGEDLPTGFGAMNGSGEPIVRSPFETEFVAGCVQQVITFCDQSKTLPSVEDLLSWFESLETSTEESISIVLSVVQMMGLRLLIARGDGATVLRMFHNIREDVEQNSTAPSTSLKKIPDSTSVGTSSETRSHGKASTGRKRKKKTSRKKDPSGTRNPDDPASNSTSTKDLSETQPFMT